VSISHLSYDNPFQFQLLSWSVCFHRLDCW